MKKALTLFISLCISCLAFGTTTHIEFTQDSILYELHTSTHTATLKSCPTNKTGQIIIPNALIIEDELFAVTSISQRAFYECSHLTTITFSENTAEIGDSAFYDCNSLNHLDLPKSLQKIGVNAFAWCDGIKKISCRAKVPPICDPTSFSYIDTTIPLTVLSGSVNAYKTATAWKEFTNIQEALPNPVVDGITYELHSNTLTASVKKCPTNKAGNVSIVGSIKRHNQEFTVTSVLTNAFVGCKEITSLTLPASIDTLHDNCFLNCVNVTRITSKATVPPVVENGSAFLGIPKSTCLIVVPAGTVDAYLEAIGWSDFTHFEEEGVVLQEGIYYLCSENTHQAKVLSCDAEKTGKVVIPATIKYNSQDFEVTTIDTSAFEDQFRVDSVFIPLTVKKIEEYAFAHSSIPYINLTDSIQSIGKGAFNGCKQLKSIYLPNGLSTIQKSTFHACTGITAFDIPESVVLIDAEAFASCTSLTHITIPAAVEKIASKAFGLCTHLQSITVKAMIPPEVGEFGFHEVDTTIPVTIPAGTLAAYKAAPIWSDFTNFIEEGSTQVQEVTSAPVFTIENGLIITEGPVTIYNLAGQDVSAQNGQLKGTYILVQDGKAVKIVIK